MMWCQLRIIVRRILCAHKKQTWRVIQYNGLRVHKCDRCGKTWMEI